MRIWCGRYGEMQELRVSVWNDFWQGVVIKSGLLEVKANRILKLGGPEP